MAVTDQQIENKLIEEINTGWEHLRLAILDRRRFGPEVFSNQDIERLTSRVQGMIDQLATQVIKP